MADSFFGTSTGGRINYYTEVPTFEPSQIIQDIIDPIVTPDPVAVTYGPQQQQQRQDDPTDRPVRIDINALSRVEPSSIIHHDFGTYMAQQKLDRSGMFSGVKSTVEQAEGQGSKASKVAGSFGVAGATAMPVLGAFDTHLLTDPTGKYPRSIPKTGLFNPIATMKIANEFRDMNKIRQAYASAAPGATTREKGFIFNTGGQRGNNIYRLPGESLYRGTLKTSDGQEIPQDIARNIERLMIGRDAGQVAIDQIVKGQSSSEAIIGAIVDQGLDTDRILLETSGGGYKLDGSFYFSGGGAMLGNMDDLESLAQGIFSVKTAAGIYDEIQSMALARSWLGSARALGSEASMQAKLSNLKKHIDEATNQNIRNAESKIVTDPKSKKVPDGAPVLTQEQIEQGTEATESSGKESLAYATTYASVLNMQKERGESNAVAHQRARAFAADAARYTGLAAAYGKSSGESQRTESFGRTEKAGADWSKPRAMGGTIGYAEGTPFVAGDQSTQPGDEFVSANDLVTGGENSGFIRRPPSEVSDEKTIADDVPTRGDVGGVVINASAVSEAGEKDIAEMIRNGEDYIRRSGKERMENAEQAEFYSSEGEVYIDKQLADVLGRDRLRKINDRGKPATEKKIKQAGADARGAARGGFIGYNEGTDSIQLAMSAVPPEAGQLPDNFMDAPRVTEALRMTKQAEEYPEAEFPEMEDEIPQDFLDKLNQHWSQGVTRTRNVNFFKTLSDVELLAYMIMAETATSNADPQDMYAVAQTAVNRMNSTDPNLGFRKQDTLQKVLLKQRPQGAFEYEGMDKTRGTNMRDEYNSTYDIFARGAARAYAIATDVLSGEMESSPAIPENVMWYEAPSGDESWMTRNLDFFDSYGGHNFYTARQ